MPMATSEYTTAALATNKEGWVRLQSTDGFSYLVKRKVAQASGTIRNMLDPEGGYAEALNGVCEIQERGIIVEKLVEYMSFKTYYESINTKDEIPLNEFLERIPPEIILELYVSRLDVL
ncbi:Elongin-C [Psilocybe cubensis]|uniref:Elongin-C n=2 Tax=Psilocybe cubensis TaxID=181762 RepID=A0A8H7XLJ6_PSICU|nr:Elongin-C [Psilocybe cubensis]KAH9476266.1 Elongin-C [Psilocybe cubensis]